jgi:hypothetical protein
MGEVKFEAFIVMFLEKTKGEFDDALGWIGYTLDPNFAALVHRLEALSGLQDDWRQLSSSTRVPGLEWQHGAKYREQRLYALS